MSSSLAEAISVALLLVVLGWTVVRPWGLPELVVALPAASVVILTGAIPLSQAAAEARRLGPAIVFLAAMLVLARLCEAEGLFGAFGNWMARAAAGQTRRLLVYVFVVASATTAVFSLDATIVLLAPVVLAVSAQLAARPKPYAYASTHLANTASLLLPVSNLTNLLAFFESGISFIRFAALMALPWAVAIGAEYAVFSRFFAADLDAGARRAPVKPRGAAVFPLVVVACTLAGFTGADALGINPAWVAWAGALVLAGRTLAKRLTTPFIIVRAAALPFLAFVTSLGIIVRAVVDNGLAGALSHLVPGGTGLLALLAVAVLAAVLANIINNLPAVLVLLPLTLAAGPAAVLAMLIGLNIGPNLTYTGSLATMLWRRIISQRGSGVNLGEFTRLGLLTVPFALLLAVLALYISLMIIGT